jgi:hypothetical protein
VLERKLFDNNKSLDGRIELSRIEAMGDLLFNLIKFQPMKLKSQFFDALFQYDRSEFNRSIAKQLTFFVFCGFAEKKDKFLTAVQNSGPVVRNRRTSVVAEESNIVAALKCCYDELSSAKVGITKNSSSWSAASNPPPQSAALIALSAGESGAWPLKAPLTSFAVSTPTHV